MPSKQASNRTQELLAQSRAATFMPGKRLGDVEFGLWRDNQFSGHTGRAPFASLLPRTVAKRGTSEGSPFCAPAPVFASRTAAQPLVCPQGRPTGPPRVEAFLPGLDQRSM